MLCYTMSRCLRSRYVRLEEFIGLIVGKARFTCKDIGTHLDASSLYAHGTLDKKKILSCSSYSQNSRRLILITFYQAVVWSYYCDQITIPFSSDDLKTFVLHQYKK